ncbi:MAG TPA: extracellular solute-binding protein [Chloroflexota bacterium]|nr:extracellular solute-binding protein [Chloroflexota bacterium]
MNRRAFVTRSAARLAGLGAAGVVGSATFSGCGPAGGGAGTQAEAPAQVQVLDAWGPGPWTERLYADWSAQLATKYPKIKVEFIMTPEGTNSVAKTTALLAAGTPPDVTLGSDLRFAFGGNLLDLEPMTRKDKEFASWQWNPPSWEYVNITLDDGKPMLWAMPGNSDARVLYVNLDLLAKEGIPYTPDQPWSWDEFQQYARTLTKRRADGTFEQVGFNGFGTFMGDLHVFTTYAGGDLFQRDPKTGWVSKATFNAPPSLEALEYFVALAVRERVGLLPGEPTTGLRFQDGTVAIQPSWSSFFSSLNQAQPSFKWDLLGYPVRRKGDRWPNQFANGSQMGSILKDSKRPDPSYTVLKYLAGPEGHLLRQRAMGAPPSIMNQKALWDEWLKPPPQQTVLYQKIMSAGKIGPWSKIKAGGSEISTRYADELKLLLAGQSGPRQFADRMTEEANRLLASGGQ